MSIMLPKFANGFQLDVGHFLELAMMLKKKLAIYLKFHMAKVHNLSEEMSAW